jgi:hypothetical protein
MASPGTAGQRGQARGRQRTLTLIRLRWRPQDESLLPPVGTAPLAQRGADPELRSRDGGRTAADMAQDKVRAGNLALSGCAQT